MHIAVYLHLLHVFYAIYVLIAKYLYLPIAKYLYLGIAKYLYVLIALYHSCTERSLTQQMSQER